MTIKKKLTATTMAATLLLGSAAGFPYSSKGLLSALGVHASVISAAAADGSLLDKFNAIRAELAKDPEGIAAVRAARDKAVTLSKLSDSEKEALLKPIWSKITMKMADENTADHISASELFDLINSIAITFDPSADDSVDRTLSVEQRETAGKLARLAGLDTGIDKITFDDFDQFFTAAIADLKSESAAIIADVFLAENPEADTVYNAVYDALQDKLLEPSTTLQLSKVLNGLGITIIDIGAVKDLIGARTDTPDHAAQRAIESALLRYMLASTDAFQLSFTSVEGDSGRSLAPSLKLGGATIPDSLLTWSVVTGSQITYNSADRKFVLENGASSASATISVHDTLLGVKLYEGSITLEADSDGFPIYAGGGAVTPPTNSISTIGESALKDLDNIVEALKNADPAKKADLIEQARAKVTEAINKLATIDLSKKVIIEGTKATLRQDNNELLAQIKEIIKQADALNAKLKELDPQAQSVKVVLTLELGDFQADSAGISLTKELLQGAKVSGVEAIAIIMNGLGLTISADEFGADTTLNVTTKDASAAEDVTELPVASQVYEFEFVSGGTEVTNFKTPIQLSIPVQDAGKFDTELLTLAKILDGKLIFFVGIYEDGHLEGTRNSFSTYTVVENKVSFNDTSSVQNWAGRQIQVAAAKGIVEGRENHQFVPNGDVTRAEFAKMIVKTFGLEDPAAAESFADVDSSDWYSVYVASAVKNGIVNGRSDGQFDPNGKITRAEMAAMASRALMLSGTKAVTGADEALAGFKDGSAIAPSLRAGVALAASEGIIIGQEGGSFNPNDNSTRAQAAVVIYRLLNQ